MYKKYLEEIDMSMNKSKVKDIIEMLMCSVKDTDKHLYDFAESEMYEAVYGKKLSKEMAECWVQKCMKPIGEHWTMAQTTEVLQSMGYSLDPIEFYVVMNLNYNDYYDLVKDDDTLCVKMTKDWLDDTDAVEDKLYEYWKHIKNSNY